MTCEECECTDADECAEAGCACRCDCHEDPDAWSAEDIRDYAADLARE